MKKIGLYKFDSNNEIEKYFSHLDIIVSDVKDIAKAGDFDLVVTYNCPDINLENSINVHPAILPAYKNSKNPLLDAFNDGVKVSGITIHKEQKILAQYPVLLSLDMHFDEFEKQMAAVQNKLLPVVIDCVINDRVFDFQDLFKSPCATSGCAGCGKCH